MSSRREPARLRWLTYGRWAGLNLLAFGLLYPLVNWFTSLRSSTYGFYLDGEAAIPFQPGWIWGYLSINLLFLMPPLFMRAADMPGLGRRMLVATVSACGVFVLLPAHLGFERMVPVDGPYAAVFATLFQADGPHNLVPSLHVGYATLCVQSLQAAARAGLLRAAWWLWLLAIMASTVLVHQHHLLDVVSGLLLAVLIVRRMPAAGPSSARAAGDPGPAPGRPRAGP